MTRNMTVAGLLHDSKHEATASSAQRAAQSGRGCRARSANEIANETCWLLAPKLAGVKEFRGRVCGAAQPAARLGVGRNYSYVPPNNSSSAFALSPLQHGQCAPCHPSNLRPPRFSPCHACNVSHVGCV